MIQTIVLLAGLIILAGRAASMVLGPVLGWLMVLVAPAISLRALVRHPLLLPPGAYRLAPQDDPELYRTVAILARRADLPVVPPVYVLPSYRAEAYTTGVGSRAVLLLSRGVLDTLSLREVAAVVAHEISHIRNLDLPLFALAGAMQNLTRLIAGFLSVLVLATIPFLLLGIVLVPPQALLYMAVVPVVSLLTQLALLRTREFQADRGAVELTGDPQALASALIRLEGVHRPWWNVVLSTPGGSSRLQNLLRTHPGTAERVERIMEIPPIG